MTNLTPENIYPEKEKKQQVTDTPAIKPALTLQFYPRSEQFFTSFGTASHLPKSGLRK